MISVKMDICSVTTKRAALENGQKNALSEFSKLHQLREKLKKCANSASLDSFLTRRRTNVSLMRKSFLITVPAFLSSNRAQIQRNLA